jgi:hypothetical protein
MIDSCPMPSSSHDTNVLAHGEGSLIARPRRAAMIIWSNAYLGLHLDHPKGRGRTRALHNPHRFIAMLNKGEQT